MGQALPTDTRYLLSLRRGRREHAHAGPACRGQAEPADMVSKNTETLKNMNSTTAKFAKWYVRILDPKIIEYSL